MGHKEGNLIQATPLRGLVSFLAIVTLYFLPLTGIKANDCSHELVCSAYPADLPANIFSGDSNLMVGWKSKKEKPVNYQPQKKSPPQPTANQNIFPGKRKGLTPKAPEPASPAFSGVFTGYPPCIKSTGFVHGHFTLPEFQGNSHKIRPPPQA